MSTWGRSSSGNGVSHDRAGWYGLQGAGNTSGPLKVLPPEKLVDLERMQRFVNRPNIITVYDIDESGGLHIIAMECVEGKALDEPLAHQRLRLKEALQHAVQIADALAAAHKAGIVPAGRIFGTGASPFRTSSASARCCPRR